MGLGGGQTTPDWWACSWQLVVQRSTLPATKPQSCQWASLAAAREALPAPVFVDCQDCLGSESASGQTALIVAPMAALRMAPHRSSLNIEGDPVLALVPKP